MLQTACRNIIGLNLLMNFRRYFQIFKGAWYYIVNVNACSIMTGKNEEIAKQNWHRTEKQVKIIDYL